MSWILQGGSVSVPKRLLAMCEPLELGFEEMGELIYLLYLEGVVSKEDRLGQISAKSLSKAGLINWNVATGEFDLVPLFNKIYQIMGIKTDEETPKAHNPLQDYAQIIKKIEKEHAHYLTVKQKNDVIEAVERYGWDEEILFRLFSEYLQNRRKTAYDFSFFAKLAYTSKVHDLESLEAFLEGLDFTQNKVREVLQRLGKYNYPAESQRELYEKWSQDWNFSHEMILKATHYTYNADSPSMGYMDSILADWRQKDLRTPEAVEAYYEKQEQEKEANKAPKRTTGKLGNKFVDNKGYRDLSHLEE